MPSLLEMLAIGVVGVLLFGHRLSDLGRAVGRSIGAFRAGLAGQDAHDRLDESSTHRPPKALGYTPPDTARTPPH